MNRFILGIETSTPHGGIALADPEGNLVSHRWGYARTGYSRRLLPSIDSALREIGATKEAITAIAVTNGPGSFTGVRVGLTTAKTLAHAMGIPLYLFSTLDALAARCPMPGILCVAIDARRSEIYAGVYEIGECVRRSALQADVGLQSRPTNTSRALARIALIEPRSIRSHQAESCAALLDAVESMESTAGREIFFAGDGATLYWPTIEARLGARARRVPPPWNLPAADAVAILGARALAEGRPSVDPIQAAPDYLRASDAERGLANQA